MINILPINDLEEHIEDTTCECCPKVEFENGEMIVIHNSFDGRELLEDLTTEQIALLNATSCDLDNTIYENTQLLVSGFNKGELSFDDLKEMLIQAEQEEEFEVAKSLKDTIDIITKNNKL